MTNEKVRAVYNYIKQCADDGFAPTVREICNDLGIKSTSSAQRYIEILEEEGLIEKTGNKNRTIRLAGPVATRVPIVGKVSAGQPITAIEDITDYINVQVDKRTSNPLFALTIEGESMIKAGILDGDTVIVEKVPTVRNGEIAICLVEGEDATCKRFFKEDGHYRLQPENDSMAPIIVDDCEILGRVITVIRYL